MKTKRKWWGLIMALFCSISVLQADDWREKLEFLTYSPRYFGPKAFPFPELMGGKLPSRWEVEIRGEYHTMTGDQTKNIFTRLYIPIAKGKAGIMVNWTISEWYKTSEAVRDERSAVGTKQPIPCHGDIVLNFFYQILRNEKWADISASANLKTASGNRLCDARYTDAASYWFDANIGRDIWKNPAQNSFVRIEGLAGFYCWMTNLNDNRQNDAVCYGGAVSGAWKNLSARCDLVGFHGYLHKGDRPLLLRTKLEYEIKKNIISFRYHHGLQDYLYDSYSLAYIRCF